MKSIADEYYYLILDDDIDVFIPLLESKERTGFLMKKDLLETIPTVTMYLDPYLEEDSRLVDYFGVKPVFSLKVSTVFRQLNLPYLQLIPIDLQVSASGKTVRYEYLRVCNFVPCIDIEKSDCVVREATGTIQSMKKAVLDIESLSKVPLKDRLLFLPKRGTGAYIYHESIVEKILTMDTLGISFIKVEEWKEGMQFH